jgi:IS5 family transposase
LAKHDSLAAPEGTMRPKQHETTGSNDLFRARLDHIIYLKQELAQLAERVDCSLIDGKIAPLYRRVGSESRRGS